MEERREQQQSSLPPQPVVYPPAPQAYAPPQPSVYAAPQPYHPPASRPNVFLRTIRLLMRRVMYGGVLAGRALRPRIFSVLIIFVLLCVVAVQSLLLIAPRLGFGTGPVDTRTPLIQPPVAVQDFIQGQREYDAEKMWNSFSPRFQAALLDNGTSKEVIQVRADNERDSGQRYGKHDYIGGVQLNDGRSMYFYMINVESPNAQRSGPMPFVFTVDKDGKIIRVE